MKGTDSRQLFYKHIVLLDEKVLPKSRYREESNSNICINGVNANADPTRNAIANGEGSFHNSHACT